MKIKTKKQLNLPQLIEYIWDKDIKNEYFRRLNRGLFKYVWVNEDSDIEFDDDIIFRKNDLFTVEVEEEITEDTVMPKLLLVYESGDLHFVESRSIKGLSKSCIEAIHILNDDLTMTLIWRDGKLVE